MYTADSNRNTTLKSREFWWKEYWPGIQKAKPAVLETKSDGVTVDFLDAGYFQRCNIYSNKMHIWWVVGF